MFSSQYLDSVDYHWRFTIHCPYQTKLPNATESTLTVHVTILASEQPGRRANICCLLDYSITQNSLKWNFPPQCYILNYNFSFLIYTGLFEMIVMDLTTCHKNTLEIGVYVFFYLIKQHSKFVTQLTGALYVHPLWFYKHQHDNPFRSKLSVACQRWWFLLHTHPVSWNCAYPLRMELSDGGSFPNLVLKCRWTIVTDRHSRNVSTQNTFSLPFAAILANCAPSGEMHN